jgi:hypothetical protein
MHFRNNNCHSARWCSSRTARAPFQPGLPLGRTASTLESQALHTSATPAHRPTGCTLHPRPTNKLTHPQPQILLALGIGVMRSQRKKRLATAALEGAVAAGAGAALEGFGIVTLASLFPVLMVELLGIITSLIHPYDDVSHAWLPASRCLLQAAVCWPAQPPACRCSWLTVCAALHCTA